MPTQRSSLNREYDYDSMGERGHQSERGNQGDRRHDPERRRGNRDEAAAPDREISLGTGTILGIFFALAITCGVFFGFGYQMGHRSSQPAVGGTTDESGSSTPNTGSTTSKPSANNPFQAAENLFGKKQSASQPVAEEEPETDTPSVTTRSSAAQGVGSDIPNAAQRAKNSTLSSSEAQAQQNRGVQPSLVRASVAASSSGVQSAIASQPIAATATGTFIVQVAAVSHQEDAELLDSALKQRGYAVFVRQEPQDHLLHVQVGPFATRRDADLIRQHLLADGYNALLK